MKIINRSVNELIPYVNNTRTHSDEQVQQIASSIKEFGFTNPVLLDENNGIIAGHGRVMGAKLLNMDEVPTITLKGLSEAQIKAYIIADNKLALNAGWDEELLKVEIEALQEMDFNIDLLGFDTEELEEIGLNDEDLVLDTDKADEVPEVEENPIIKLGDLIELGHNYQHRVLCGDSTSEDDVKRLMDGKKADICFTSPPYNVAITPHENGKYRKDKDDKSTKDYTQFLNDFTKISLKFTDYVFSNIQSLSGNKTALISHIYEMREKYADTMVWDKDKPMQNPAMARRVLNSSFEYVYIFSNDATRAIGKKDFRGTIPNIFQLKSSSKREFSNIHKATFDVELPTLFIDWFVESSIYDSFAGTGTTLIASENKKISFYGMELDEKYAQVIVQRYIDYTSNPMIKINGKEIDWNIYKELEGR